MDTSLARRILGGIRFLARLDVAAGIAIAVVLLLWLAWG
jgi:hypothetical protein